MLITTGKKPDLLSRLVARALFLCIPGSCLEGRGKRTLSSLVKKAGKRHFARIASINKKEGGASEISFISLDGNGNWRRLTQRILISYAVACKERGEWRKNQSCSLRVSGAKRAALMELLAPLQSDAGCESRITAGAKSITLKLCKTDLLILGVSYEG